MAKFGVELFPEVRIVGDAALGMAGDGKSSQKDPT
jgi:hypothetical protein